MSNDVDAVIAALKTVLKEAEARSNMTWFNTRIVNRWIAQLPGAWMGRWRHLKLSGDIGGDATRADLISHVRATLAYLETNREAIRSMRGWSWPPRSARSQSAPAAVDADFSDVPPDDQKQLPKPRKSVRVIN